MHSFNYLQAIVNAIEREILFCQLATNLLCFMRRRSSRKRSILSKFKCQCFSSSWSGI